MVSRMMLDLFIFFATESGGPGWLPMSWFASVGVRGERLWFPYGDVRANIDYYARRAYVRHTRL